MFASKLGVMRGSDVLVSHQQSCLLVYNGRRSTPLERYTDIRLGMFRADTKALEWLASSVAVEPLAPVLAGAPS